MPTMKLMLAIAFLLALPWRAMSGQAQDLAHVIDSLRERVSFWDSAAGYYDSITRADVDTVRVGGFAVITNGADLAAVEDAVNELRDRFIPIVGPDTILFQDKYFAVLGRGSHVVTEDIILAGLITDNITSQLHDAAQWYFGSETGRQFQSWLGPRVPITDSIAELPGIYEVIVLSPLTVVQRCHSGDIDACGASLALGLHQTPEEALRAWFNAADRRFLVGQLRPQWDYDLGRRADQTDGERRCIESESDADCVRILAGLYRSGMDVEAYAPGTNFHPSLPLDFATHSSLAAVALELGGDGAYSRLITSNALEPEARLEHAARASIDSVLRTWHAWVLRAAPPSVEVQPRSAWVTLFWVVVTAFLAAGSSRWR